MYEENISKMTFKELRAEVQCLRDELAIIKRKYEDAIYNLDSGNFGKSFTVEQNNMKAQIRITAEGLKSTVSKSDLESGLESCYSEISQTAEEIRLTVNALESSVSEIGISTDSIIMRVSDLENFKTSVFTQTADGFTLDGEQTTFTGVIYLTDNTGKKKFSASLDESQGYEQAMIHSLYGNMPIVIGQASDKVYIGGNAAADEAATKGWVENEARVIAVFG